MVAAIQLDNSFFDGPKHPSFDAGFRKNHLVRPFLRQITQFLLKSPRHLAHSLRMDWLFTESVLHLATI